MLTGLWIWRSLTVIYVTLIFYLSSRTSSPYNISLSGGLDKIVHFVEFGILGVLLSQSFRVRALKGKNFYLVLSIGIIYAALDEIHQYFVPMRDASLGDFLADALGLTLFYLTSILIFQRIKGI